MFDAINFAFPSIEGWTRPFSALARPDMEALTEIRRAIMEAKNSEKQPDKYGGMVGFDMELTPSVVICGVAGAVLGAILAMWGTSDVPIIIATTITFSLLSGIFGFFVPWYKPAERK